MTDIRAHAIQRTLSQLRGITTYQLQYLMEEEEGVKRELHLFLKLQGEKLEPKDIAEIRSKIGRNVNPREIFEIFQILCLKVGSETKGLTFSRSENDSNLLELLMSTEMMVTIADICKDVAIENIMMLHGNPIQIEGAPNQTKTTTIGLGLTM